MTRAELLGGWERYASTRSGEERALNVDGLEQLRRGRAVAVEELAEAAGLEPGKARQVLVEMARAGRATLVADTLSGVAGPSVEPAPHQLTLDGAELHTCCALDTVGIPAAWTLMR